jgi:gamma-glutamyl hydrolase
MRAVAFLCAAVLLAGAASCYPHQPFTPIIGIMTDPFDDGGWVPPAGVKANAAVESYYVRWLEAAGVRVVPFPWNATAAKREWLMKRVNGVLFPGGDLGGKNGDQYFANMQAIFDLTMKWNAAGDPFMLWGTCMGFQFLNACAARTREVISWPYPGMEPLMMPLNFTAAQPGSRLFGDMTTPKLLRDTLQFTPSTLNWHQAAVLPSAFEKYPSLGELFTPITLNTAPHNGSTQFVSAVEAKAANIHAVQFHPERPPYEFSNDGIGHAPGDIAVSRFLADFVAKRLRMNNHSFDTPGQAEALMIENHPSSYSGWGMVTYWLWEQNE